MRIEDLQSAIDTIKRLKSASREDSDPIETSAVLSRTLSLLEDLKNAAESSLAELDPHGPRGLDRDALDEEDLGLDEEGAVKNRRKLVENIHVLADNIKSAQSSHRKKKADISLFLNSLWPDKNFKTSKGMEDYLKELEGTRRLLIALKKHLGRRNASSAAGAFKISVGSDDGFKADYQGVLECMLVERYPIKLNHPSLLSRFRAPTWVYATRYYYNTLLIENRTLTDDSYRQVNQIIATTPETVDFVFGEGREDPLVVFYTGNESEQKIQLGPKTRANARRLPDLERVDADFVKARRANRDTAGAKQPKDLDGLKLKKKHEKGQSLLTEVAKLARVNAGDHGSEIDYAKVLRELHKQIRACRIHATEVLETYRCRHNQSRFRQVIPTLGKSLEYVAERIASWEEHLRRVTSYREKLEALEDEGDEAAFKAGVVDLAQQMLTHNIAGSHLDVLTKNLSDRGKRILEREFGSEESLATELREAGGASALAVFMLWLLKTIDMPEDAAQLGISPGMLVQSFILEEWREAYLDGLSKVNVEHMRKFALITISREVAELGRLIRWARGDLAERAQTDWVALGEEIEEQIKQAQGIVAFADKFEGSYATLRSFLTWILYGRDSEHQTQTGDSTPWDKCLYVGDGSISFTVYIKVEAKLLSLFKAGAKVGIQVSGQVASEDDRRVRWRDFKLSVVYKAEVSGGTPSVPDILENQAAIDVINAKFSASVGGTLGGVTHVRVYESHLHMAASLAETFARAQLAFKYPFNRIAHPFDRTKHYSIYSGVPETETQRKILEDFVGNQPKLKKELELLERPRLRAWIFAKPTCKLSGDISGTALVTLSAHGETTTHSSTHGRFEKTTYDEAERVRKLLSWSKRPALSSSSDRATKGWVPVNAWSHSYQASAFSSVDLGATWKREVDPGESNPLDFLPIPSDSTGDILSGSFSANRGSIDVSFTHIENHPNPDNDGCYMNIKAVRTWGGSLGSDLASPVSVGLSFQKTRAKKFSPRKLRAAFNRMVSLSNLYFRRLKANGDLPSLPGNERPTKQHVKDWLGFLRSPEGGGLGKVIRELAIYGIFDMNFIYNDNTGFEVQYGRIWRQYDMGVTVEASPPGLPFFKVGGEIAGSMKHCPYETLGLGTLTYILTVRNGLRKRTVVETDWWEAWVDYHKDELHALFNRLRTDRPVDGSRDRHNTRHEVEDDLTPSKHDRVPATVEGLSEANDALKAAAQELLDVVDGVTISAHAKASEIEEKLRATGTSRSVAIGFVKRRLVGKRKTRTRLVLLSSYGTGMIWLHDDLAHTPSRAYNLENFEETKAKPIDPQQGRPMLFLRPTNSYKILWGLTEPHLIKSVRIELLDKAGAEVCHWDIAEESCDFLAYKGLNLKSKTEREHEQIERKHVWDRETFEGKVGSVYFSPSSRERWEGSGFRLFLDRLQWDGTKDATLSSKTLTGGAALSPTGSPFCLRLVAEPLEILPDLGVSPPLAWTYFHVFDEDSEDPIGKLTTYLDAKGAFQPFEQESCWKPTEVSLEDLDVDSSQVDGEVDGDLVMGATSEVHVQLNPVIGVNTVRVAVDLGEEELDEVEGEPLPDLIPLAPWNGHLGPLLLDQGHLTDGTEHGVSGARAYLVQVVRQQQTWSCAFHSLKNALFLLQLQRACAGQQDGVVRGHRSSEARGRINEQAPFDLLFLDGGTLEAPAGTSWLKIAEADVPKVRENGLTASEQARLLAKVKAGTAKQPDGVDGAAYDAVVCVGQFGPKEQSYFLSEGVGPFVRALRSFDGDAKVKAFTLGVANKHFVTCLLHKPINAFEVLVADSLNQDFASNHAAIAGLLAWARDPDEQVKESFKHVHTAILDQVASRGWTLEEIEGAIEFLEGCEVMRGSDYLPWRQQANEQLNQIEDSSAQERVTELRGRLKLS